MTCDRNVGLVRVTICLHPQLTLGQALRYAAELRLPPSTSAERRREAVHSVAREDGAEIAMHRQGGQADRLNNDKRASLAVDC